MGLLDRLDAGQCHADHPAPECGTRLYAYSLRPLSDQRPGVALRMDETLQEKSLKGK